MTFSKYLAILNSELYWAIDLHLHGIGQHVFCSITPNINTCDEYIITAPVHTSLYCKKTHVPKRRTVGV